MKLLIEGWIFAPVKRGWWSAVDPTGRECGRGGLLQVAYLALGRILTAEERQPD